MNNGTSYFRHHCPGVSNHLLPGRHIFFYVLIFSLICRRLRYKTPRINFLYTLHILYHYCYFANYYFYYYYYYYYYIFPERKTVLHGAAKKPERGEEAIDGVLRKCILRWHGHVTERGCMEGQLLQVEEDLAEQPQLDETDNSASSAKLYLNRK